MDLHEDSNHDQDSECPWWFGGVPVVSQRAIDVLGELLLPHTELLPIEVAPSSSGFEYDYFAVNVITVVDCLDHDRSLFKRYSTGRIMKIERYSFIENRISGIPIFKIPESTTVSVFVSSKFRSAYKQAGLTGWRFEKVYPQTFLQRLKGGLARV
jgi:hypothetical protein